MSSVDKVALYQEAADALRAQANAVPAAIQALEEANAKVYSAIQSVEGDGGPHVDKILEIVTYIQKELKHVQEAVEGIPVMLNAKAEKIEDILKRQYSI